MLDSITEIKNKLQQNVLHISSFEEVNALLFSSIKNTYVIFDSIVLKNYFLNNTNDNIINCNSSYERFVQDMQYFDENSIICNVNSCTDLNILNLIDKTNNIKID